MQTMFLLQAVLKLATQLIAMTEPATIKSEIRSMVATAQVITK